MYTVVVFEHKYTICFDTFSDINGSKTKKFNDSSGNNVTEVS